MFAECIPSDTRRTRSLPSAEIKTLGKKKTLGKIRGLPSVKLKTLGKEGFAECFFFALGKRNNFFSGKEREEKNEKKNFAECPDLGHSAKEKIFFLEKKEKKKNKKIKTLPSAQI